LQGRCKLEGQEKKTRAARPEFYSTLDDASTALRKASCLTVFRAQRNTILDGVLEQEQAAFLDWPG
jgi:hypothetical protein